jgi:pilus assembly protein Flp/PilA
MMQFLFTLQSLVADRVQDSKDRGATAVEYALMVALIAVAIITAVIALGTKLIAVFGDIAAAI